MGPHCCCFGIGSHDFGKDAREAGYVDLSSCVARKRGEKVMNVKSSPVGYGAHVGGSSDF